MPNFEIEAQHQGLVGGVDEAGRGPWAGPVVAACAIFLNPSELATALIEQIQDSKKLSKPKREELYEIFLKEPSIAYGIGQASVEEIDHLNILRATFLAMERAVHALPHTPQCLLIDGKFIPSFDGISTVPVIKGDDRSLSIAAASILAKVTRDRMMDKLAQDYPTYGWEKNAGYGTAQHQKALHSHGVTPHHRKSFAPIKTLLSQSPLTETG